MSTQKNPETNKNIQIPWGAWHGDAHFDLAFPNSWEVGNCQLSDAPPLSKEEIIRAIQKPIDSMSIKEMANGKKNIVIAVEDITRPSKLDNVLETITTELLSSGVERHNISFVVCNGAHAPMMRSEMVIKYGQQVVDNYLIHNHNPYENLIETEIILGKTPVKVNRYYYEADLKIAVGSIMPHNFAGFSSGGKLVLPGLCDIATLERSHKYVMMGFRGGVNDVETNKFRLELEDVVSKIGMDFFVGIVPNSNRFVAGLFSGNMVQAHRVGVDFARQIYRTIIEPADIIILNAYPKDTELIQADAAFTPLNTTKEEIIKENGVVVVLSRCSNGLGYHSMFGSGMRLHRKPIKRRLLKDRDLYFFSPNINQQEFNTLFWEGYHFFNNWDNLLDSLKKRFPNQCKVMILPCAPLHLLDPPS